MREAAQKNLYRSYLVGKRKEPINILQYADDTVFVGEVAWENVSAVKALLRGFEMASGLKINFTKSQFGIIGGGANWGVEAAHTLNCGQMDHPFLYLGIPIGANPSSLMDQNCPLCGTALEDVAHLFFNCNLTKGLWWESMRWIRVVGPLPSHPKCHFTQFCEGFGDPVNQDIRGGWWIALTSSIWHHRNNLIFQGSPFDPYKVMDHAIYLLWSCFKVKDKDFNTSFTHWSSNISKFFG
ncbi:hypothetical protein HKD37_08G022300 [Glycine soja]|nr:hypothetical protein GmHk_08G022632 [Glycine max]